MSKDEEVVTGGRVGSSVCEDVNYLSRVARMSQQNNVTLYRVRYIHMMNSNQEMISALLEADRKRSIGRFRRDTVLDGILAASTPRKAALETVTVEFTPSGLTDTYINSWFNQVARVFRGSLQPSKPELTGDTEADKVLFGRYLETIFWRKMVAVDRTYGKGYNELIDTINDHVMAPALFTNAVNCIGTVQVHSLAIRLLPQFAPDYDWKNRILNPNEFLQVADWIYQLMDWGFQAYEGFNARKEGNLDFMLMTVAEEEAVESVEADITLEEGKVAKAGEGRTAKFIIKSQRAASNITALYRYFFHNKKIEFLSDTRLTYSYSTYEETEDAVEYIVNMMIWENNIPSFLGNNVNDKQEVQSVAAADNNQVEAE